MNENREHDDDVISQLHDLHRSVVRWLGAVILVAVIGIITIALVDSALIGDFVSARQSENEAGVLEGVASRGTQTDQAVAILGNVASAGVGALAGWIVRDFTIKRRGLTIASPPGDSDG